MSGENIYNLLGREAPAADDAVPHQSGAPTPYTGKYEISTEEQGKPTYSTFYEKGREYDGTNVRFFKQRDAVIGKSVSESVYPQNYLKKGEGVHAVVPPMHKEKIYTKPPIRDVRADGGISGESGGNGSPSGDGSGVHAAGGIAPNSGDDNGGDDRTLGHPSGSAAAGAYLGFGGGRDDDLTMGVPKSRKNFIASNIVEVSNMVPKNRKDQPQYATDRKDFGRVPAYLDRVKEEVDTEKAIVRELDGQKTQRRQQVYDQYVYKLDSAEQAGLIDTLHKKLKQDTAALASMPFSLDTPSAAKKKSELQRSIKDIEAALGKLEKEAVFIYRDDPVNGQWTKNAALEEAKKYVAAASQPA